MKRPVREKTWRELVVDGDGLLREREVIAQREPSEPKTPATPTLGVHRDGGRAVAVRLTARNLLLLTTLAVACGLVGGAVVAGALQWQRAGAESRERALLARVEAAEADAREALVTATAPMTAYERCEDDLRTAWVLFQHRGAGINPPSCTPPRVTRAEYVRAFTTVGGSEWVTVQDGQAAP